MAVVKTLSSPHPVTRTLQVSGMVCPECEKILADALPLQGGVESVQADWRKGTVTVRYDLHRCRLQDLEQVLTEVGYPLDKGFLARQKRHWMRFKEQNEVDHMNLKPHCCSKPPPGA